MRTTTFARCFEKAEVTISETVVGRGERTVDALQNLLDCMEMRALQIRSEISQMRQERL